MLSIVKCRHDADARRNSYAMWRHLVNANSPNASVCRYVPWTQAFSNNAQDFWPHSPDEGSVNSSIVLMMPEVTQSLQFKNIVWVTATGLHSLLHWPNIALLIRPNVMLVGSVVVTRRTGWVTDYMSPVQNKKPWQVHGRSHAHPM